ncbi:MAG: hypothetical protein HC810_03715 [Acaryochloridaceae cyanobacterium RL_2_7]|nr:hypothetical protein [Acaryochloridaceae cyanobacterium RL_2_7]
MLARTSAKRLRESLLQVIASQHLEAHLKVVDCYKDWSAPSHPQGRRNLSPPSAEDYEAMAIAYNRHRGNSLGDQTSGLSRSDIQEYLNTSIRALRLFSKTKIESLNQRLGNDRGVERIDLTSTDSLSLDDLAHLEALQRVNQCLSQGMKKLLQPSPQKTSKQQQKAEQIAQILPLIYGDLFSQEQVGQELEIQQTTVYRRLKDAKSVLWESLRSAIEDAQAPDPQILKHHSNLLDAWLYQYFAAFHSDQNGDLYD